jgi:hypothetical protein
MAPADMVRFFRLVGDSLAYQEEGIEPSVEHKEEVEALFRQMIESYPEMFPSVT